MSEERTQAPSKLRRQQARESGHVAHSAELTGAAGLLVVVFLLGVWGDDLAAGLLNAVQAPLREEMPVFGDAGVVVAHLRAVTLNVAWPLLAITFGGALGAFAAHQVQVGGLWTPGRLAPDPTRLWALGRGPSLAARGERGAWSIVKAIIIVLVTAGTIRSGWRDFQQLSALETPQLAPALGAAFRHATLMLAGAVLVLGLVDFGLQYQRFEAMLRLTPEEEREDLRTMEGDPALRARRRRLARSRSGDERELVAGATLALTGPAGLIVLVGGAPPPRRFRVLAAAKGATGASLRRAAESVEVPLRDAPDLARRLAGRRTPALPLEPKLTQEIARLWPVDETSPQGRRVSAAM